MNYVCVSSNFVEELKSIAYCNGIDFDVFEGTLNDSIVLYNAKKIKITGIRRAKYIIVKNTYLNCYSSELRLFVTDDFRKVEKFRKIFYK